MESIRKNAYAKVNIALNITGRREDGYHELDMIFLELDLCDRIEVRKIPSGIRLTCGGSGIPADESNLAYRAAALMKENYSIEEGVDITLEKRIPSQAGLGGGSSDAACVMRCMNELFDLKIPAEELEKTAVKLGADVPFFIKGGTARAKGIGDQLEDLGGFPECGIVVVKPEASVSTPWAYKAFDALEEKKNAVDIDSAAEAIRSKDLERLCRCIGNDLEGPVAQALPVINDIKKKMTDQGAAAAMMTGSGSAVFGLFESREKAAACAAAFKGSVFVTEAVSRTNR